MNALRPTLILLALIVIPARLLGAEPELTTKTLLANWQRASREVRILDTQFVRLTSDQIIDTNERDSGRFYWESPNRGYYQLEHGNQFIWNDDFVFVDPVARTYLRCSSSERAQARERLRELETLSGVQWLMRLFESAAYLLATCEIEDILPLGTTVDADEIERRFDVTWQDGEGKVTLTAVPKVAAQNNNNGIREIGVILDRRTFGLLAHRRVDFRGGEVVHIFEKTILNAPAPDRARLLDPDLNGLTNMRAHESGQIRSRGFR